MSLAELVTSSTTTITVENTAVATATNTVTLTSTTYSAVVHSTITVATPTRTRFQLSGEETLANNRTIRSFKTTTKMRTFTFTYDP